VFEKQITSVHLLVSNADRILNDCFRKRFSAFGRDQTEDDVGQFVYLFIYLFIIIYFISRNAKVLLIAVTMTQLPSIWNHFSQNRVNKKIIWKEEKYVKKGNIEGNENRRDIINKK
jgi:hypothetical protein